MTAGYGTNDLNPDKGEVVLQVHPGPPFLLKTYLTLKIYGWTWPRNRASRGCRALAVLESVRGTDQMPMEREPT